MTNKPAYIVWVFTYITTGFMTVTGILIKSYIDYSGDLSPRGEESDYYINSFVQV